MTGALEQIRIESMRELGFGVEAMKEVKICPECGNPSPSDEQFCRACGHRLPEKTLYDLYKERHKSCPNCDTVLSEGMAYCPQCGAHLYVPHIVR